ncbi:MAG: hypothetical protein HYT20_03415 [Candidatus Nealsonbacteria bacterium]|nr:hypothetical protein [Candidatus Nealsonbacteria bacterium]
MEIYIAIASMLAITFIVWLSNKIFPFKICPICAGISGTWLWVISGLYLGWLDAENWRLFAAMGMGSSIVGIAYQLEKKISNKSLLLWKTLFIPAGFAAMYGALMQKFDILSGGLIFLLIIVTVFLLPVAEKSKQNQTKIQELKNKMKNCC